MAARELVLGRERPFIEIEAVIILVMNSDRVRLWSYNLFLRPPPIKNN